MGYGNPAKTTQAFSGKKGNNLIIERCLAKIQSESIAVL